MEEVPRGDPGSRLKGIDKASLLSRCPLFAGLSRWDLLPLSMSARLKEFKKDEVVYAETQESSAFYVIVSGRFEAYSQRPSGRKTLAYFAGGDHFGEIALLTQKPHSATVVALSDSLVFELKKADFNRLVERHAKVSLELSRRLSGRLKDSDPHAESLAHSDLVAVFKDDRKCGRLAFDANLAAGLSDETRQKTLLVHLEGAWLAASRTTGSPPVLRLKQNRPVEHEYPDLFEKYVHHHPGGYEELWVLAQDQEDVTTDMVVRLLSHLLASCRFVIVSLPDVVEDLTVKVMTHADTAFFLTGTDLDTMSRMHATVEELKKDNLLSDHKIAVVLEENLLGARSTTVVQEGFFAGLRLFRLPMSGLVGESDERQLPPVVLERPEEAYARAVRRISRFVSGNVVGLALGSGAAHGLAHIGVLKVLERENIPIDIIAGSSIGALIGSLYALGQTASEIERDVLRELSNAWKVCNLIDFNLFPVRGMLHGNQVVQLFKKYFKNKKFEDCQIPLKIVAADLSTWQAMTLDSGSVSDAVRASIAIPAIFKPVMHGSRVVVDGGIFSPLPIGSLRRSGAHKVIAVNVFPSALHAGEKYMMREAALADERTRCARRGPLRLGLWHLRRLLAKLFYPNVLDILMNTIQAMESEISDVEAQDADLLIRPVIPEANWVDFHKPRLFIQKGEEAAEALLPKIKELIRPRSA